LQQNSAPFNDSDDPKLGERRTGQVDKKKVPPEKKKTIRNLPVS